MPSIDWGFVMTAWQVVPATAWDFVTAARQAQPTIAWGVTMQSVTILCLLALSSAIDAPPKKLVEYDGYVSENYNITSICWDGPGEDWGGTPILHHRFHAGIGLRNVNISLPSTPEHDIFVAGDGCVRCIVGQSCSFVLKFKSDIYFHETSTFHRDFMATLIGPSLVHVTSQPIPSLHANHGSSFTMRYQTWDAGNYHLVVNAECVHANDGHTHFVRRLVTIPVVIHSPRLRPGVSPCSVGLYGRWKLARNFWSLKRQVASYDLPLDYPFPGEHTSVGVPPPQDKRFTFRRYKCVTKSVSPDRIVAAMAARGVSEISFVGDSHTRSIFNHLRTLIDGSFPAPSEHSDIVWHISDPNSAKKLRLNLYFVEGVYREGEFGCRGIRDRSNWPSFSNTSDIVVLSAASWSFLACEEPAKAYTSHLAEFMDHYVSLPHKETTKFFWRSSPPFARHRRRCYLPRIGHKSAGNIAWANSLSRLTCEAFNVKYLDFWNVEAPRYADTCELEARAGHWVLDAHFSCQYSENTKVYGVVGEAVALLMLQYLVRG